jgi:hypothetical protein
MITEKSIWGIKYIPYFWQAKYLHIRYGIHIVLALDVYKSRRFMHIEIHRYIQI